MPRLSERATTSRRPLAFPPARAHNHPMSTTGRWQLRIYENGQEYERTFPFSGAVQIGRQKSESETPFSQQPQSLGGVQRVVIARLDEYDRVSRTHAVLTPLGGIRFRVENISQQ